MKRPPAITRATVSVEYDDGGVIVYYQEADDYRTIDAGSETHGLNGTDVTIHFPLAPRSILTTPEATEAGRREVAAVLDTARTLTDPEAREQQAREEQTRTKAETFLAWLNGGGAAARRRRGTPPPPPHKRPGNTVRVSKD